MSGKKNIVDRIDKLTTFQLILSVFSTKCYFKYIKPSFSSAQNAYAFAKKLRKENLHYTSRMHISLILIIIVLYISEVTSFISFILMFTFVDVVIIKTLNNTSDFVNHEIDKKPIAWIEERVVPAQKENSVQNTC